MKNNNPSPFHRGEQQIQAQLGVKEDMERFGKTVIRDHMPERHREFYQQLEYLLIGHVDQSGWPWASILFGQAKFIHSRDNQHLSIKAQPIKGDPLVQSLVANAKLGLLGIELHSRRRNRMAAHVGKVDKEHIELKVDQVFGNCPKYIQARSHTKLDKGKKRLIEKVPFQHFDEQALTLIAEADTFFVSSFMPDDGHDISEGVDVSHRGGKPGFIHIDNKLNLTVPDYAGNHHFNTLGNFIENPKAGLLFMDFDKNHLLMLTGTVDVIFESPAIKTFSGAERLWTFQLDHGMWLKNALPIKWQLDEYSPFLDL